MYKKSVQGWLKHLDFMILDVVCLWISFTLAFNMRHGSLDVLANSLYRDMMWSLALMDIVVIFFFDSLKNVLKRGFYQEFVMTVKQTCLITLCSVFYLFTFKEAENYSRLVLGYTAALYLLLSYVLRCLWKNCLRKYFGGAEKRSLLIVTVSDIVDTVIDNIKNKNYGDYFVTGVCILDKKAKGRVIDGVTVVADEDDLVEYVCREWVDEVFINIPESEPYPAELLDKFIEMGVVVHMKLAKSQNLLGKKQFVEHLGTYTVLTTSINSVSRRQIIFHAEGPCAMLWLPKLFGKRCIATVHGLDHQRAKWGKLASTYIMLGEKCAVKCADEIIVLSKGVQDYFKETYGRETKFIPNGVNRPVIRKPELIKEKFGLEKDDYVLFLGRLVPEKGIEDIRIFWFIQIRATNS